MTAVSRCRPMLGTFVEIKVHADSDAIAAKAVADAF